MKQVRCIDCFWFDQDIDGKYCGLKQFKPIENEKEIIDCNRFDDKTDSIK